MFIIFMMNGQILTINKKFGTIFVRNNCKFKIMIEFKDCKVIDGGLLIPKEELLRLKEKWERYEKQYRNVAFDTLCLDIETKSVGSFEQELDKVSYFCARSNTKTINAMLENFTQN